MPDNYDVVKGSLLRYIRQLFEEIEEELARSHEEKYALLEDALESSSDEDELRVAFEQWYTDHADELELDYEIEDIWDNALAEVEYEF